MKVKKIEPGTYTCGGYRIEKMSERCEILKCFEWDVFWGEGLDHWCQRFSTKWECVAWIRKDLERT